MTNFIKYLVVAALIAVSMPVLAHDASAQSNLLVNGSFEANDVDGDALARLDASFVAGWESSTGQRLEIWDSGRSGVDSTDGSNHLELDNNRALDGIFQDVQTVSGQTYELSFDIRSRGLRHAQPDEAVVVEWNGQALDPNGSTASTPRTWETITANVIGTGGLDRLLLREPTTAGASDNTGPFLDNISLEPLGGPAPTPTPTTPPAPTPTPTTPPAPTPTPTTPPAPTPTPTPGPGGDAQPIAWWTFDQPLVGRQTADSSVVGPNYPGALRNGVNFVDVGGSLGRAATFDGQNNFIAATGTRNQIDIVQQTVSIWFNTINTDLFDPNGVGRKQTIFELGNGARGLNIYVADGSLYVGGWRGGAWTGTYLSTDQIQADTWHHVALVLDAPAAVNQLQDSSLIAYLDGVEFGRGDGAQVTNLSLTSVTMGAVRGTTQFHDGDFNGTGGQAFDGRLADVQIFDQALSATAIRDQVDQTTLPTGPPTGTLASEQIVSGLTSPTSIDWIPGLNEDVMIIAEKNGVLKQFRNGTVSTFLDITDQVNILAQSQGRGITDIAVHPDFVQNPYVYVFFVYDPPQVFDPDNINHPVGGPDRAGVRSGRVSRFTADAANDYLTVVPGSEVVLLGTADTYAENGRTNAGSLAIRNNPSGLDLPDYIAAESQFHNTGSLEFGSDGSLYVSLGDGANATLHQGAYRSQDLDNLSGKVLRVDPLTGNGLPGNPFFTGDVTATRSKVYQYGLRNPFRFTIHPTTGEIYIGETGWNTWEEVNAGGPGVNFGWPHFEGGANGNERTEQYEALPQSLSFYSNPTPVAAPIFALSQPNDGARSVVMGDFYFGSRYPSQFSGNLFFTDATTGIVRTMSFDQAGNIESVDIFDRENQLISQIIEGPGDYLYFVDFNDGFVGRYIFE